MFFTWTLDRTKFANWQKKYEKFEAVQLEFEVKMADNPSISPFMGEIDEKLAHMNQFKKTFAKFCMLLDSYLAKDCVLFDCKLQYWWDWLSYKCLWALNMA